MALQVIDDVLDYEQDLHKGELNCLASSRWEEHLDFMEMELDPERMSTLYSRGLVFRAVIRFARRKARRLRRKMKMDCRASAVREPASSPSSVIGLHAFTQKPDG